MGFKYCTLVFSMTYTYTQTQDYVTLVVIHHPHFYDDTVAGAS